MTGLQPTGTHEGDVLTHERGTDPLGQPGQVVQPFWSRPLGASEGETDAMGDHGHAPPPCLHQRQRKGPLGWESFGQDLDEPEVGPLQNE
jgi:hypothetical protein